MHFRNDKNSSQVVCATIFFQDTDIESETATFS